MELFRIKELLEDTFELDEGSIQEDMVLEEQEWWDSLGKLSLIVLVEDECGKRLSNDEIKSLKTVKDIISIMQ